MPTHLTRTACHPRGRLSHGVPLVFHILLMQGLEAETFHCAHTPAVCGAVHRSGSSSALRQGNITHLQDWARVTPVSRILDTPHIQALV